MATPMTYVEAPPRTPRPNTSLQVLPVIDVAVSHHLSNQFIPDPCAFPNPLPQDCWVTMGPAAGTLKTFGDAGDALQTSNFGAYQGVECWLSGGIDTFSGVAERVLRAGEYRVVDGALVALLAAADTPVTPAATTAAEAIGLLETVLATQVPALGYIFLSPLAASYAVAAGMIRQPGIADQLYTFLGTPVVVLSEPSMGLTAYAAGPVTVWRGPIIANQAPALTDNLGRALAERLYSIAIECGVWSVTVPAPAGASQPPTEPDEPLEMILGSIPSSPIPDGTDTTIIVQTNVTPTAEVFLHYAVNGGADTTAGEMTQTNPHEFVWNVIGTATGPGDSVEVWAVSEFDGAAVESNHITIEVV